MTGLAGGRVPMPPNPRPPAIAFSPVRKPFRSIPAQNVPPAPVSTITWMSVRVSSSSRAAAIPLATASLTALRAEGRSIVTTATGPSTSVSTASDTGVASPVRCRGLPPPAGRLLRLEPDTAVEPDYLGVHVVVLDQRPDQVCELGRRAHPLREHYRDGELRLELLAGGPCPIDGCVDDPWADRVDPDSDGGQVTGGRHGHADDPALGHFPQARDLLDRYTALSPKLKVEF